jgi:hypothetical protein
MRIWTLLLSASLALSPAMAEAKKYDNKVYIFKVEDDKFSKTLSYAGLREWINPFGGTARNWMLRTWIDKETRNVTHQLYVEISYSGSWRFYQSANNEQAISLPFIPINRSVGSCFAGCSFTEIVGVELSDELLREKALTGFQVKLFAKSGDSLVIDVTRAQIQSQLMTDNQFLPEDRRWTAATIANDQGGGNPTN